MAKAYAIKNSKNEYLARLFIGDFPGDQNEFMTTTKNPNEAMFFENLEDVEKYVSEHTDQKLTIETGILNHR